MNTFTSKANGKKNSGKILVTYFSVPETTNPKDMTVNEENSAVVVNGIVLGNTQYVARLIAEHTDADLFRIEPVIPYPVDHATLLKETKAEWDNGARPELMATVNNIDKYEVVFVGYPNWFDDMPMILYTFLENMDLSGKTIIPFSTHGGSGFSGTINTITRLLPNAVVEQNGFTVSRDTVDSCEEDIVVWLRALNYMQ